MTRSATGGLLAASLFVSGCGFTQESEQWEVSGAGAPIVSALEIDAPVLGAANTDLLSTPAPLAILDEDEFSFEDDFSFRTITLQSAVQTALMNSQILRDLGGSILRAPNAMASTYDVALQEMDPRFGVAGALSAFDTAFATEAFFEKNDRAVNNQFFGGGTRKLKQDLINTTTSLTKTGATGTQYTLRNETGYDSNNAPGNSFRSVFETWFDAEVRHPLLQGTGTEFNRIAGPNGTPGALNGVVLARLNSDISQADFEIAVRDFVSNVENAYWDLYYAYRELDARIVARDASLDTWNRVNALLESRASAEKEAQAREQYYRFQQLVQDALSGRPVEGTKTNNGAAGGSFRGTGGVMTAERRLRLLLGIEINGKSLLRPDDEKNELIEARVIFDWKASLVEGLSRRSELRRQKWLVTRRERELQASRNFLMPNLDLVGRYRWRGQGKHLLSPNRRGVFGNNLQDSGLTDGNFQEWQLGFEFAMPLGRRQAFAAVEHAELQLARDRAVLSEQEREVVHQMSEAFGEMARAYATLEISGDRRLAAAEQLRVIQKQYDFRKADFDLLLDAQRRHMDAETTWYKSLCEYNIAIRNVHYAKGSLLDYNEIFLTEDMWPVEAYREAQKRNENRIPAEWLQDYIQSPAPVTNGPYYQNMENQPIYDESVAPMETVPAADESGSDEAPANLEINSEEAAPTAAPAETEAAINVQDLPRLRPAGEVEKSQLLNTNVNATAGNSVPGTVEQSEPAASLLPVEAPVSLETESFSKPAREPLFDDEFPLPGDGQN